MRYLIVEILSVTMKPIKLKQSCFMTVYVIVCYIHLSRLTIPTEALNCRDTKCNSEAHKAQTKLFYDGLCNSLIESSNGVFGSSKSKHYDCKPGFNDYVKDLHETARKRFVAWREAI